MADPVKFPEANGVLECEMEGVDSIPVYADQNGMVSCHQLTDDELEIVKQTGKVWLMVLGHQHPPVALVAQMPFKPAILGPDGEVTPWN